MAERKVTISINGDASGAIKAVSEIERSLARLKRAQTNISSGRSDNTQFKEFNNLSKQQFADVQRLSKERQRLAESDNRVISQKKIAELRVFEATEKSKLRLVEQSAKARTQAENNGFKASEAAKRREFSEYQRIERQKTQIAAAEGRRRSSFSPSRIGGGLQSAGQGLQGAGIGITAAVSLPIIALGKAAVESAVKIDSLKRGLISVAGSADEADKQFTRLIEVAKLPGLGLPEAIEGSINLQAAGFSAETAERALRGFGNALATVGKGRADLNGINIALTQMATSPKVLQEEINQIRERLPQFSQLMINAFGSNRSEDIQKLGISGKQFVEKILTELEKLPSVTGGAANAFENLSDTISQALLPLGNAILPPLLSIMSQVVPIVENLSARFAQLSPSVQQTIIVVAAIVAALGPLLVIFGSLVIGVGALVTAFGTISVAVGGLAGLAPVVAGIGVVLGVVAVAAVAFAAAWRENIGGIQQTTEEVFNNLKTIIQPAIDEIASFAQESLKNVADYFTQNLPTIIEAVQNIVKGIQALWATHGAQITAVVKAAYTIVKSIIVTLVSSIGNVILLVANVINGNWKGAWANFKAIVQAGVSGSGTILKSLLTIVGAILAAMVTRIASVATDVYNSAIAIGKSLLTGLANGISSLASGVYNAAREVATNALNIISGVFQTQSPSKETTKIGEFVGEGLALGIESKIGRAKSAAKKMADETVKELNEAFKAFQKLAGASPEQVARIQQTTRISEATNSQGEIIKLRGELGVNNALALPSSVGETDAELKLLQFKKKEADDFLQSLENITQAVNDMQTALANDAKAFEDRLKASEESGAQQLLNLREELQLLGVTDEFDRKRIQNQYEILRLRQAMQADGFGESQIAEAEAIQKNVNAASLEYQRLLDIKRQGVEASGLAKDLDAELESLRRNGQELSQYEITLRKIETSWKDLTAAERANLLGKAAQVDAQKEINEQYSKTYNFIRNTLDTLTDSSKSLGDRLKSIFGGIAASFKKMFLDMAAQSLTSKLFGGGSSAGSQQGGGGLQNILGSVIGGGQSGSGPVGGASSSGGIGGIIKNFLGGGGSRSSGASLQSTGEPVVDKITESNEYLKIISERGSDVANINIQGASRTIRQVAGGGGQGASGGFIGSIVGAIKKALGGGGGGGAANTRSGSANILTNFFANGSGIAGGNPRGQGIGTVAGGGIGISGMGGAGGAGSILSQLTKPGGILGKGGIFGAKGFGFNSGTISGLGGIASIAGGAIGGTAGGILSGVGAGIAGASSLASILGVSSIGGPIGLAIGAAVGGGIALFSALFGKSKRRKKEEKQRTEFLQTSFKGLEGYDQLIKDVRSLRIDGASAITQGESLGASIRTQYVTAATALKDKKTRNIALKDVSRIDAIIAQKMEELRKAADVSNAAKLRADRIIPEFATGMFFGRDDQMRDMHKSLDNRRGYINGGRLGVDRHLGLFADGEAILNRQHQQNINRAAGFNVIAEAGIPNYPKGNKSRRYAEGNIFGANENRTINQVAPIVKVELQNINTTLDSRMVFHTNDAALKDVSRIDTTIVQKIVELRKVVDVAKAAKLRVDRIIPKFAEGGYFADYFKPNGLLPGRFDGRDDILAKISRGEMVLNPNQIQSVIARAGHDVFAGVVPNYPKAKSGQRFAEGGRITGVQPSQPIIKVELHNVNTTPDSRMVLYSDDGKRQVVDIVKEAQKNRVL